MKRIFILLIILTTGSFANASFRIMVDGHKNFENFVLDPYISLGIYTDSITSSGGGYFFALVAETAYGTIDYTTGYLLPPYDTCGSLEHSMSAAEEGFPLPGGQDGIAGVIACLGPIPTDSVIADGISLYLHHPPSVNVYLYVTEDFETVDLADSISIVMLDWVSISVPAGGESWVSGSQKTIEWSTMNMVCDYVKIEWSSNNGSSWIVVENSVPNTGSYLWTVPVATSNQCRARVTNLDDPYTTAVSNIFTIFQCRLNSKADLDGNCKVDMADFALLANDWLRNGNPFDEGYTEE